MFGVWINLFELVFWFERILERDIDDITIYIPGSRIKSEVFSNRYRPKQRAANSYSGSRSEFTLYRKKSTNVLYANVLTCHTYL